MLIARLPENVVLACTSSVLELLLPITVFPSELRVLLKVTVALLVTVRGDEKPEVAATVRLWLLLAPRATFAFAVIGAVAAKVVAELTVKLLLPLLLPRIVLPRALKRLLALTVTAALAVTGAANVEVAGTVSV